MDPLLGWPTASTLSDSSYYDHTGSRIIPSFPNPDLSSSCISLYGDSYTESSSLNSKQAWSNLLSNLLSCRVSNYGVAAYGTDQAFLRYEKNIYDSSSIVVLNHFVDDIKRNLMQHHGEVFFMKPRFILNTDKDGLDLLPLTLIATEEEFEKFRFAPKDYLQHDLLAPGAKFGPELLSFPYMISMGKLLFNIDFQTRLKFNRVRGEYYRRYYFLEEPLLITTMICKKFANLAQERNQYPVVTIIPHFHDFEYFRKKEVWGYEPLISSLRSENILVLNFGSAIIERYESETYREIYDKNEIALHFNERGDSLLAECLADFLGKNSISFSERLNKE
ncbi:MAG: hypothetical protein IIA45_00360 [Bacteroidetes bacterium]|nr:hypothetical protein [Bacteroidota bacterium]